jgi:siroheme synthase-like protein
MADAYPVFLQVAGMPCLVVGGGAVGQRKVLGLLAGGARVTVVAPEVTGELREWGTAGRVRWTRREFQPADLDGMRLAFAATSDAVVNRRVAEEGAARGLWVNVADDPRRSDFHVPAVLRRGDLAVAVATGGASPALAAWVRDCIDAALPGGLAELAALARRLRDAIPAPEAARFRELFDSGIVEDLARGDREAADRKVVRVFGDGVSAGTRSRPPRREKR